MLRFRGDLVRDVYGTPGHPLLEEAVAAGRYVHEVTAEVAQAMSPDSQGILAVATPPEPASLEVLQGARLAMVLPQVADPGNAGTLIRIADAAGADAVVICRGGVEVTNPKVVRASAGSIFHLPIVTGVEFDAVAAAARGSGLAVVGADGGAQRSLFESFDAAAPTAWVFGNEAQGLSDAERALCDTLVSIPLYGHAESLNVAAAAAVCMYASASARG